LGEMGGVGDLAWLEVPGAGNVDFLEGEWSCLL
jgi:hypothetical protein